MTDNKTAFDVSNKWFELANDTYRTYVKTLVWSQERALELTKTMVGQADSYQRQGKGLVEEYSEQLQRAQQLFQGTWEKMVNNSVEMMNQYRAATNASLTDLNSRLDSIQTKIETANKPVGKASNN